MGFFKKSSSGRYDPAKYMTPVSAPSVSTNTVLTGGESPKEAESPELKGYWREEKKRRENNGVRGSFRVSGAGRSQAGQANAGTQGDGG